MKNFAAETRTAWESKISNLRQWHETDPADFWHTQLFWAFWISIALFPIGYGFREVAPPVCFIFLAMYYRHDWNGSVLKRLKPKWLFYCAGVAILIGIVFSNHPWASLLHAGTGVNKAFILPFIAMECARDARDLRRLVWAFALACFWEGLDGLWQAHTGKDFIFGYPTRGEHRLTGSLGDYTVGNYLALALIPAAGLWFILREMAGRATSFFIILAILWPAVFTLQGAGARSSVLALAGAAFLWVLCTRGIHSWRLLAYPGAIFILFILLQPARTTVAKVTGDNRWDLWRLGWEVFKEYPFFGAGAGQYNTAFRELGLAPLREQITITHPHNLYLDILYAHGAIGFGFLMVFLVGFLFWLARNIIPQLHREIASKTGNCYWRLTACMGLGYAGWFINGVFGHDFYRIWWLAMAMTALGITIGAVVNGQDEKYYLPK